MSHIMRCHDTMMVVNADPSVEGCQKLLQLLGDSGALNYAQRYNGSLCDAAAFGLLFVTCWWSLVRGPVAHKCPFWLALIK